MKNSIVFLFVFTLSLLTIGCSQDTAIEDPYTMTTPETIHQPEQESVNDFGAHGALEDNDYTIEEMLTYAIQDEYLARMEYEKIMEKFGEQRPFSNILKAEVYHIELLEPLFTQYEFLIPEDTSEKHVIIPDDLKEALETGVQAEIDNIAMYERFLEEDLEKDIRDVFEELMNASKNHLKAFQTALKNN